MSDTQTSVRHECLNPFGTIDDGTYPIVQEIDLTAAVQFTGYRILYYGIVFKNDEGLYR